MRKLYYIFLATALLAGCSKHSVDQGMDPDAIPGHYIFFDAEVMQTKAAENLEGNTYLNRGPYTSFGVFGVRPDGSYVFDSYSAGVNSPFDNVAVVYRPKRYNEEKNEGFFQYDNLALWHSGEHKFYAYYIAGVKSNSDYTLTTDIFPEIAYSKTSSKAYAKYNQPTDLQKMADILTASVTSAPKSPINFEFGHMLFALDVVLINDQIVSKKEMKLTDAKVEFTVKDKWNMFFDGSAAEDTEAGDCTVSYDFIDSEVVIDAPSSKAKEYNLNEKHAKVVDGNNYYTFLFPPCNSLKVKFEVKFLNSWDELTTFTYDDEISVDGGFLAGTKYQFKLRRDDNNGDEIPFTTSVEAWTEKNVDHTFN